ncbi:probable 3-hydroxyisobutyrate dehydrogenase-like 1, mitochondrial [Mercurialis annua]|uniref:probable 3-hydroxyisobutyrate dehydrogenase-like 1, mitochondrial n=1 Tax=Mercurialis annua TaxID=3986 RepID=UPI0021601927|nr:probable 3-hydroxyisobutyrate dehydrogenase-like 1, mitochondrial [Mercurialis annua]
MPLSLLYRSLSHRSHHHNNLISLTNSIILFLHRSMATATTTGEFSITPSTTRIGWIGTGVMGRSMCSHLIKAGYSLTVFNRTLSKAQPLLDMGANLADSPLSVAKQSDVVFSIVGFPSDVRHVLLNPITGALQGLRPGGVLIDMTTSDPSLAVEIFAAASAKSCHSIDAPVSGGDRGAKNGTLAIFAGGDKSVVDRVNPIFALMGKVNYMGTPGKGQFAKLANQITIASTMVGLVEGIVYAYKAGLNVELYLNAISTGAAGSKSIDLYGARILNRDFEAGFYVNHFVKDLGICLKECEKMGVALPGLALAQQLYLSLKAHGEGNLGTQALILALERLNNFSLPSLSSSPNPAA